MMKMEHFHLLRSVSLKMLSCVSSKEINFRGERELAGPEVEQIVDSLQKEQWIAL